MGRSFQALPPRHRLASLSHQPVPAHTPAEAPGFPAALLPSPWLRWQAVPGADNGQSGCCMGCLLICLMHETSYHTQHVDA